MKLGDMTMTDTNEAYDVYATLAAARAAERAAHAAAEAADLAAAEADAAEAAYLAAYDAYRAARDAYDATLVAKKMTPKQAAFVAAYLDNGGNGSRAARDAGYSGQETNAALDPTK